MTSFGSALPPRLATPTPGSAGAFPRTLGTYTSSDGGIVVPPGALDRWFAYRASGAATPRDVLCFGDSTMFGSGGGYSIVQRLRDRAVASGLPDGGKGLFGGLEDQITYDAPEVNGFGTYTFAGSPDSFDMLGGSFLMDAGTVGHYFNFNVRATGFRLWYIKRNSGGDFTYAVDGGSAVTVNGQQSGGTFPNYVVVSGLSANTTHTVQIVNTGGGEVRVGIAPINASGPRFQKQAMSGATFATMFFGGLGLTAPYTQSRDGQRYQPGFGLVPTSVGGPTYTGAAVDTTHPTEERPNTVLAMTNLGFNDLTASTSGEDAAWTEYVKRFAGACYDASCDGIVIAGQLPYNANWPTYGAARFTALKDTAAACGLAFVDSFLPIGGPSLSYAGGTTNPHLTKAQYVTQADYLWDGLLGA